MHNLQTTIQRNNERVDEHRKGKQLDAQLAEFDRMIQVYRAGKIIPGQPASQNSPEGTP